MKVALLSSYSIDLLPKETDKILSSSAIKVEWYIVPFNQYTQEVLNPSSDLRNFNPQVVLLSLKAEDFLQSYGSIFSLLKQLSSTFPSSTILVHNCALLQPIPFKLLQWNTPQSVKVQIARINQDLSELAQTLSNIYILDLEDLIAQYGRSVIFDARFHYLAKTEYSLVGLQKIAGQLAIAITILVGKRKKCLILDLDDTIWGGILGEEGIEHIKLSNDGEGKAFYDLQATILKLYDSGVIIAICSKNDENLALEVFEKHPYMLLKK